jgi:hypothetical protein
MTETAPTLIADGVPENLTVWFEHLGEYYDDVLVSFEHDEPAVAAIRALLSWDGWWDADFQVWRVNPGSPTARRPIPAPRHSAGGGVDRPS